MGHYHLWIRWYENKFQRLGEHMHGKHLQAIPKNGQALLPSIQRSISHSMVGHHCEEDDREDNEVKLA
jgi:hypothetical protein